MNNRGKVYRNRWKTNFRMLEGKEFVDCLMDLDDIKNFKEE